MTVTKQVGAMPLRKMRGEVEVLLVTSRETGRWIIPKGWPEKKLSDAEAAAREALEEAGVEGMTSKRPVGSYTYFKRLQDRFDLVSVSVFALWVEKEHSTWPEMAGRTRRWFTAEEASELVLEPGLVLLITNASDR